MATNTASEITFPGKFDNQSLYNIGSFSDAMKALDAAGLTATSASEELGNGFSRTDNKTQFVGVPLILVQWQFLAGDQSAEYVSISLCTKDNGKYTISDGGTGIYAQLKQYSARTGRYNGLLAEHGLTESEYHVCQNCGKTNNAKAKSCRYCQSDDLGWGSTFYIAE